MTLPQPLCKFSGPAVWGTRSALAAVAALATFACAACSSPAATSKGAAADDGSGVVVGTFQVQVAVNADDPSTGLTKILGQVGDAAVPSNVVWTVTKQAGGCRLQTPSVPFCEAGCGADVCVADNQCEAYPTAHDVGAVTLTGAKLTTGGASLVLKQSVKTYQPPAGTAFTYPPFAAGDAITLHAEGGDYTPFDLAASGVDPLQITSTDFELDVDKAFALTWGAAPDPKASSIYLKLELSHHGGIRGMIECDGDDNGSLTIPAALMTDLIGLGVAGFPTVVLLRRSLDSAPIAPGRVQLEVSSKADRPVTVKGVASCNEDPDCPSGKTCRTTDSTCQ